MKLFSMLALLGLAAGSGYRYYTRYRDRRETGPTTEPPMIRSLLHIHAWDVNDVVRDHEEPVGGRDHYWANDVRDPVTEHTIPEMCHVTPENCTLYNTFFLDCNCIKELESVGPECRSFKCDAVHYILEHGADIFAKFVRSGSIKEAVQVIHRELTSIFEELNVCKCGKEFLGAAFRCAPFYNGNALLYFRYDKEPLQRYLRTVDFKSLSKVFDRLMDGICAETSGGRCLNSIFTGLEEVADIVGNTMKDYEEYDEGDRRYQKRQEKRCDTLFGPFRAWEESEIEIDSDYVDGTGNPNKGVSASPGWSSASPGWSRTKQQQQLQEYRQLLILGIDPDNMVPETYFKNLFDKTAVFMNSFYCDKGCKKERRSLYPCCMRTLLEDKTLFNAIEKVIVKNYRTLPALSYYFEDLDSVGLNSHYQFYREYDLEEVFAWTIPQSMWDVFMRTIHAAKYCQGTKVKCSDNRRPEA